MEITELYCGKLTDNKRPLIANILTELNLSVQDLKEMTNLSNTVLNSAIEFNGILSVTDIIKMCVALGIHYTDTLETDYYICNKNTRLLDLILQESNITNIQISECLGVRLLELDLVISKRLKSKTLQRKLLKLFKLPKDIDLNTEIYTMFKRGDMDIILKYIKVNTKGEEKMTKLKEECVTEVEEVKKMTKPKEECVAEVEEVKNITEVNNISELLQRLDRIETLLSSIESSLGKSLINVENGSSTDNKDDKEDNVCLNEIEVPSVSNHKYYDEMVVKLKANIGKLDLNDKTEFYHLRQTSGKTIYEVSRSTGLTVEEINTLETPYKCHIKYKANILREYYGIPEAVYLANVSDNINVLGYLMLRYDVKNKKFADFLNLSYNCIRQATYAYIVDRNYIDGFISYLRANDSSLCEVIEESGKSVEEYIDEEIKRLFSKIKFNS